MDKLGGISKRTEQGFDRYVSGRLGRLRPVRRFVAGWLGLVLLLCAVLVAQNLNLSGYYQTVQAVPGGIYNEGVLGSFTNANPLYAATPADTTVSNLIFAGLFKTDENGQLVGDLAAGYDTNQKGDTYTVHLKPGLTWQDGRPLTSADVLYTYQSIQNPDAQSPLEGSWRGIKVTAPDADTVIFKLPDQLVSFPYTMTNGIIPQHLLQRVPAQDLRSSDFNTAHPIGSGPFKWQAIETSGAGDHTETRIALQPFDSFAGGRPKLEQFIVHSYGDRLDLEQAFSKGQLTGAQGLDRAPRNVPGDTVQHSMLLRAETMTFFKTTSGVLADPVVRQSLVQAADVPAIIKSLGYPTRAVREPLLMGQLAYDPSTIQAGHNFDAAAKALDAAGWKTGKSGIRTKANQPLSFTLTASDVPEYARVTSQLQQQWRRLGVNVQVQLQQPADFQGTLSQHNYEALLYGISIGTDPDVFVYWDSSQADVRATSRLNFSEYKNPTVDAALEAGRTRFDPQLRTVKYKPFLQAWQKDAPALGLYQPRNLYLTKGSVDGLTDGSINRATDRFANVQNWQIRQAKVTN